MSEAERAIAALHLRVRVILAFAAVVFVGIAQETNLAGPDIPVRALAVGVALVVAAGIEELASRRARRDVAATAGTVAEFFALALGVALFSRYQPLAPALLLWPLVLGAVALPRTYLLYLAAMATAIVVEIGVLRAGAAPTDIIGGLAWGALYVAVAMLGASLGSRYRRFQRRTESAYASIATITAATSYSELARILFAYAERALDLPQDAPAALLFDDRGIGTFSAIEANAIDPERRARFRIAGPQIETLRRFAGPDGAFVAGGLAFATDGSVPQALAAGRPFVLPLRDARRLVGFAVFAAQGRRRLNAERRAEFARIAEQVATTLVRLRGGQAIDAQREALAVVLEAHGVDRPEMQVATWLARSARDIASAHAVAVLEDLPHGGSRVMLALGLDVGDVERGCAALVAEVRRRGVAVVVTDGTSERRIKLPDFLRTGATALLPVGRQATYLLVHEPEREGLSSGNLQLLVQLCDQAATLLGSAEGTAARLALPPPTHGLELRLAAVAAHTRGLARAAEAESRARIIDAFRLAIEGNQPALAGSGERVAAVAGALAEALGVDSAGRDAIYVAALLRDVGELGIDRRVLDTPGALNEDQREVVRRHPLLGETILATLSYLGDASRFVRAHHERWDGTGYPDRLREADIPIGARILAVADVFTALTSERPYRAALRPAEAIAAVIADSGAAFDPAVVDAFVALNAAGKVELHAEPVG